MPEAPPPQWVQRLYRSDSGVEAFSLEGFQSLDRTRIENRVGLFRSMIQVP